MQEKLFFDDEIEFLIPERQKEIGEIIVKAIRSEIQEGDKQKLKEIVDNLERRCDTIFLACTDLQLILKGNYTDSFDILVEAVFDKTRGDEK